MLMYPTKIDSLPMISPNQMQKQKEALTILHHNLQEAILGYVHGSKQDIKLDFIQKENTYTVEIANLLIVKTESSTNDFLGHLYLDCVEATHITMKILQTNCSISSLVNLCSYITFLCSQIDDEIKVA